jgi:BlaI family transcriptional regulator, penicillinase repressor
MALSKGEEQLMHYLWKLEKGFLKDLVECYPDPKPASTTIATLLKRMSDKGFVGHTVYGNSREYHPLTKKDEYFSNKVSGMIKNHFDDSVSQFASFFTSASNLTKTQLEELKKIIDQEIKKRKK